MNVEEMEQPAKRWQVEEVKKDIKQANDKLDLVLEKIDNNVTYIQMEEAIKSSKEYTDTKIQTELAKITPTIDALKKLTWVIIPVVLGLIADAVMKLWNK